MKFLFNTLIAAIIIATSVELNRRSTYLAALLISMPISSMIALSLAYAESGDTAKVASLSTGILLLVIPSLVFFLALTKLIEIGWNYWVAFGSSAALLAIAYAGYSLVIKKLGFQI